MRFGIHVTHYRPADVVEPAVAFAQQAEDLGFASVWAGDHIVDPVHVEARYPHSPPGAIRTTQAIGGMPDPFILLGVIAGKTSRIRLGFDVIVVPYRTVLPMAKQIATLDSLSGGRVTVGIGVGWHIQEFEALGAEYTHRGSWTDECVAVWRTVWTGENVGFNGRFNQFEPLRMLPKPAQAGGPPIWIGGDGPRARQRVARYGDGWIPTFFSADRYREDIAAIREEATRNGRPRPTGAIQRLTSIVDRPLKPTADELANPYRPLVGTPDELIAAIRTYQQAGVDEIVFRTGEDPAEVERLMARFAREIAPAFADS